MQALRRGRFKSQRHTKVIKVRFSEVSWSAYVETKVGPFFGADVSYILINQLT